MEIQNKDRLITSAPIFLVGFMGSGKSVVGAALAGRLSRPFIDLDQKIVEAAGRPIHQIIADDGEAEFRRLESEALIIAARSCLPIIATGGGIVLSKENRLLMNMRGVTVWLDAPFDRCWNRILTDGIVRPLAPDRPTALARFEARRQLYEYSQHQIEIDDQPVSEIVEIICQRLSDE